jgi:hypothetical protein
MSVCKYESHAKERQIPKNYYMICDYSWLANRRLLHCIIHLNLSFLEVFVRFSTSSILSARLNDASQITSSQCSAHDCSQSIGTQSLDASMAPSMATVMMAVATAIKILGAVCFVRSRTAASLEKMDDPKVKKRKGSTPTPMAVQPAKVKTDFKVAKMDFPSCASMRAGSWVWHN